MTVLNTSYTSLEDAWGSNFDVVERKRAKRIKPIDPLCELYSRKNRKSKKPYSTSNQNKHSKYSMYTRKHVSDMNKYYGYADEDHTKKADIQDAQFLGSFESGECASIKSPKRYINEEYDEDDAYLESAVVEEESEKFKKIFSNVYDESDDEVQMEEESPNHKITVESQDCRSISQIIEEELHRYNFNPNQNCFVDERQYLDLVMYTLSGIILIFMMEQFIQIGMKLKSPY